MANHCATMDCPWMIRTGVGLGVWVMWLRNRRGGRINPARHTQYFGCPERDFSKFYNKCRGWNPLNLHGVSFCDKKNEKSCSWKLVCEASWTLMRCQNPRFHFGYVDWQTGGTCMQVKQTRGAKRFEAIHFCKCACMVENNKNQLLLVLGLSFHVNFANFRNSKSTRKARWGSNVKG